MLKRIKKDIKAVMDRDPAVKGVLEVLLCYPGFHAVVMHRLAHYLYQKKIFPYCSFYFPDFSLFHRYRDSSWC